MLDLIVQSDLLIIYQLNNITDMSEDLSQETVISNQSNSAQINIQSFKEQTQKAEANRADNSANRKQKAQGKMEETKEQKKGEVSQSKKQIDVVEQNQGDKNGQINGLTQKQFKRMKKLVRQYPILKQQYEKLTKNYQLLRNQKEQYKHSLQTAQGTIFQLNKENQLNRKQIQNCKSDNNQLKQQIEKRKKDNENLQKRIEQSRKKIEEAEGISQKIKQLSLIIDMTTKQAETYKKQQQKLRQQLQKIKQLSKCEREMFNNTKVELDKLRQSQKETFTMKQELVRISTEYKNLKNEKEQMPTMIDKFQHQEHMIAELKDKIKEYQKNAQDSKSLSQKLEKKVNLLMQEKKELQKKYSKVRCDYQETSGQNQALKAELQDQRSEWQVQKRRYLTEIKTLKVQLHNQHEKLKITEWELSESKKKEKAAVKLQRINIANLTKEDMLNILEQMEMKNQSLKMSLDHVAETVHQKDNKIKQQYASIMALARQLTKSYPNLHQSQGMEYVQQDIIEIGKSKKSDWGEIVQKVMIQNLRLKYSVTALGEQFNQQMRISKQK